MDYNQYVTYARTLPQGRAAANGPPTWSSQDNNTCCRIAKHRNSRPLVIDGLINGEWFEAYVGQVLVPTLTPDDIVILDNLSSHKRPAAREIIEAAGARLMFLPPYSPDFNPIEKAFSKLKALLRKAAERTVSNLWDRIGKIVDLIDPQEAQNYFASCEYDPL
ncbi:transposase [Brucella sp. NF 2653]|uniref:transposase n=1 Tax=Brucella sp. NF 2653 TaxID=693748 RepID=UPI003D0BA148